MVVAWDGTGMVMAGGAWVLMVILNIFLTWWRWTLLQPRQQQRVLQKSKQLLCSEYNVPPISGMVCSCVLCAWWPRRRRRRTRSALLYGSSLLLLLVCAGLGGKCLNCIIINYIQILLVQVDFTEWYGRVPGFLLATAMLLVVTYNMCIVIVWFWSASSSEWNVVVQHFCTAKYLISTC